MDFVLLGTVGARIDGQQVDIGYPRQRLALAALLVDANRVVAVDTLAARLWGDQTPASARNVVAGFVSRLRKALADTGNVQLVRRSGGYAALVDPELVDLYRFRRLMAEAECADEDSHRAARLETALAQWQGVPLDGLTGSWCDTMRHALAQELLDAQLAYHDVQLRLSRHVESLPRLRALATDHPLDERLAGQLLLAAYRSGDQAAAIEGYQRIRVRLADELGVDPGPQLRELYNQMLRNDPVLAPPQAPASVTVVGAPTVPAQIPLDVVGFTGREAELARLDDLLGLIGREPTAVVVAALSGTAGIGKTALAVRWAHRAAQQFPDGQLYINLRGFDPGGSAVTPDEAVHRFLDTFAVPPERIPADLDARVDLYRSLLAGKRVLVVLDNAAGVEQVRPLLPGAPGCLVLVTSRTILTGLVAVEGARPIALDLLTDEEAAELLRRRIGAGRVAAEPVATAEIIGLCARLPLALAIAAAYAATRPRLPLGTLAEQLRDDHARLSTLAGDEPYTDIRAVFSWSYRALTPLAARLFRLLGLHPGPDVTAPAAASLAALALPQTRSLLDELVRTNLLTEHVPGRYTCHDLLRAYAAELTQHADPDDKRNAAIGRLLDYYLHTAHSADEIVSRRKDPIILGGRRPGVIPQRHSGQHDAQAWLAAECGVLLGLVDLSVHTGFNTHAWQLAWVLHTFLTRSGRMSDNATVSRTALVAARRLDDQAVLIRTYRMIAAADIYQSRFDQAYAHLNLALGLCHQCGDFDGAAGVHIWLADMYVRQGRYRDALEHDQRSLELYRVTGNDTGEAAALNGAGWCHAQLGDFEQAVADCGQALALFQKIGDEYGEASTWDSLGNAHHRLGRHAEAVTCYQHALHHCQEIGDRYHEAIVLDHLGDTHHAAGDQTAAGQAWSQAAAILGELHHAAVGQIHTKLAGIGMT